MLQLTYISTVAPRADIDIDAILAASRRNNDRAGLSGLLVYDGRRFLQALEGDAAAVLATFDRIKADPRHRAVVVLSSRETPHRQFGDWAMAWNRVDTVRHAGSLSDTVDALTLGVPDANVRALFRSFARIDRSAAA